MQSVKAFCEGWINLLLLDAVGVHVVVVVDGGKLGEQLLDLLHLLFLVLGARKGLDDQLKDNSSRFNHGLTMK